VLDGEAVVYDPRDGVLHHLDAAATEVWRRCDGARTVDELVTEIASDRGLAPAEVRDGVVAVLSRCSELGLLSDAASTSGRGHGGR
jgi:PqqD family protein of HPr-rel-A system